MDLDSVVDELYSLPPQEFTSARNAREKEAKAAGDATLARQIHGLAKPTTVAWLANQLVREHPEEIEPFLELGAGLRDATAALSGDRLRTLGRQQHQLIGALVQQARRLADAAGRPVSEETARGLEDTLHAALADEDAAAQLRAARLTDVLRHSGFTSDEAATGPRQAVQRSRDRTPKMTRRSADELERARAEETQARTAARAAEADHQAADKAAQQVMADLSAARATAEDLRAQVVRVEKEQVRLEREDRRARATADSAGRRARDAARRLADATERMARLRGKGPT